MRLHVQRRCKNHIPLDQLLRLLHLRVQRRVAHQLGRILDLATRLVQPRDGAHNRPLHHVRQVRDAVEGHPLGPLIYDLGKPEARLAGEVVRVLAGLDDLVQHLEVIDLLRDSHDRFLALLQAWGQCGLVVGLFLEDKGREEGDDLFGLKFGQHVLQNQFGENKLIGGVNLMPS